MEHDTAALCREAYETYSRGDFEALLRFFDPEIEVYVAPPVTQPSWELTRWRDGLIQRYEVYFDRDDGVRAFEEHSGGRVGEQPVDADARR